MYCIASKKALQLGVYYFLLPLHLKIPYNAIKHMWYLAGFIIPIVSFFLQSYPRFFNKTFGVDVWTRFLEIDLVRKNNHKIPSDINDGFILRGNFDYPPLFPIVLSFFPKKTLENIQGFVAPFFDALHCTVVFFLAYFLTGRIEIAILAQVIYMVIPIVALENSYLAPRSFGYLFFTLALFPLLYYSTNSQPIFLLVGFIFTTIVFLAHRFATQSLLFVSIFFSLWEMTPLYILIFLAGFISAIVVTKGYYLKVLEGHWYNIHFWIVNYKNRWAHQVTGKTQGEGKRDLIGKIYILLSKLSPITLFGLNFWAISGIIFVVLVIFNVSIPGLDNQLYRKLAAWILFFYFWAILILSVKRLLAIGEGQRYLEMATAPSAILASILYFAFLQTPYATWATILLIVMVVFNLALILFVQSKVVIKDKTRSVTNDMTNIFAYINKLKKQPRIVCLPLQITTMTIYNSKADVFVNANNKVLIPDFLDYFPIMKLTIKQLAKKWNLDYLLLRESYATLKELKLNKKDIVFRSGDIVLVKIK